MIKHVAAGVALFGLLAAGVALLVFGYKTQPFGYISDGAIFGAVFGVISGKFLKKAPMVLVVWGVAGIFFCACYWLFLKSM